MVMIVVLGSVLVLDGTNFDTTVQANEYIMVEFYAPWCGHCKKLAPEYESAASALGDAVPFSKVDCTDQLNTALCGKYGVKGYPTIKWFAHGKPTDYSGGRTSSELVKFAKQKSGPAFATIDSDAKLADLEADASSPHVLAFSKSASATFTTFAGRVSDLGVSVGLTGNVAYFTEYCSSSGCSKKICLCYRVGNDAVLYQGSDDVEAMYVFVQNEYFPLLTEMTGEWYKPFIERGLPLGWFFVHHSDFPKEGNSGGILIDSFDLIKKYKGIISFTFADGEKNATAS